MGAYHRLEYEELDKPIYWMGIDEGKIVEYKFTHRQCKYSRYIKDLEKGIVRYFSSRTAFCMDELMDSNCFSMYSYSPIDKKVFLDKVIAKVLIRYEKAKEMWQKQEDELNKIKKMMEDL